MFEEFIIHCKARGLTEKTIKTYQTGLRFLKRFLDEKEIELKDINLDELIIYINNGKRSDETAKSILSSIRCFLKYEMSKGRFPSQQFILPKCTKKLKDIYTDKELKKLLIKPKKCEGFTAYKIWVFENYVMGTGNRLGSMLSIKIKDIDFEQKAVILRQTKQRRQQFVPLTDTLVEILQDYLEIRGGLPDDYLFCNSVGDKADMRTWEGQVQAYNKARGVKKSSIHLFRHTFATMYIRNGGDVYKLSKLLGHTSVGTTEHYIHSLPLEMYGGADEFNPLEKFTQKKKRITME